MAMYVYHTIRNKLLPTVAEVLEIMRLADHPDKQFRDMRPLMSVLMRLPDADPRLGGHILTRLTAVTSFDWRIVGDEDGSVRRRLARTIDTVVRKSLDVALFGAMCIELDPVFEGDAWTLRPLRVYDPVDLDRPTPNVEDLQIVSEDERGRLVRSRPREPFIADVDERAWPGGVLRSVLLFEVIRNDMIREWANFSRKLKGIIQGIHREGAQDEERAAAEQALRDAVLHNYLITSDAIEFRFNQLVKEAAGQNFKEIKAALDADIAIAVLGQANTPELPRGGGSRAALQILQLIRADIHHSDMLRAERLVNELLLVDYRLNFDTDAAEAPWRFEFAWEESEEEDIEATARTIREVAEIGLPLLADEVYARLGFTRPPEVPDVLQLSRNPLPTL